MQSFGKPRRSFVSLIGRITISFATRRSSSAAFCGSSMRWRICPAITASNELPGSLRPYMLRLYLS
jgi:hypothetical protein